jgi:hypothetical protein
MDATIRMTHGRRPGRHATGATGAPDPDGPPRGRWRGLLATLRASLFPDPAETPRGRLASALTALVALCAVPVVALRAPLSGWDSIWAEDGSVFLQQALDRSFWHTVFEPYAGYLLVFPRLAALVAAALPLAWAGTVFTLTAAALVVWVAWTVWSFSAGLIPSPWLRAALAAVVVLVPTGGIEAVDNVANSHFYLVFGAFWVLLGRARSRGALVSGHALVLLATLTDPLTLVFLPVALARFVVLPAWRERSISVVYALGTLVQLAVVASTERDSSGGFPGLRELVFGYDARVLSPSFISQEGTQELVLSNEGAVKYVAAAVCVVLLVAVLLARTNRLAVLATAIASVAFFTISSAFALGGGYPPTDMYRLLLDAYSRYPLVPSMLLMTAWLLAAQGAAGRLPRIGRLGVCVVAVAPILVAGIIDFRPPVSPREGHTDWSDQVERARDSCAVDPTTADAEIVIAPSLPWVVDLDCSDVTG